MILQCKNHERTLGCEYRERVRTTEQAQNKVRVNAAIYAGRYQCRCAHASTCSGSALCTCAGVLHTGRAGGMRPGLVLERKCCCMPPLPPWFLSAPNGRVHVHGMSAGHAHERLQRALGRAVHVPVRNRPRRRWLRGRVLGLHARLVRAGRGPGF